MKKLKCLLCHLIKQGIVTKNLIIEANIEDEAFKTDFRLIQKLLFNGYNLVRAITHKLYIVGA